ncbi:Integral membrane protein sed5 [Vanrija pseudolonga]|uniref:Integral membrane protein sed5 n=1 Tax=Vanrija pseudolonga TaxID=143232 RepID=A0AAF0YGF3_9TREE|nr:Integral membrane protein sed5 [Vanrija pseudolonga]
MAPRDRTAEFHSALSSIKARTALPAKKRDGAKQPLLAGAGPSGSSKSEFGRLAGNIAKDINNTTLKLQKLAQLAKRKTLFDDRPIEISELTYIIRQDIASLNTQIAGLQAFVRANKPPAGSGKQVEEHNSNVVMMLQSRLANMGMGFKDVLELRTQNMKASRDRTEQFMHSASSAAVPPPAKDSLLLNQPAPGGPGSGLDRKGKARAAPGEGADFLALNLDGDGKATSGQHADAGGYQQMQLVEQQVSGDNYIQSRSTAIESIESTIAELGQIFSQLANMVAEQRETVQRIDADVTDISANVSGAQRELLKYYASISSNRWLMLKIFGVLIIFFLVFILVS